jgi:hypothetical protein
MGVVRGSDILKIFETDRENLLHSKKFLNPGDAPEMIKTIVILLYYRLNLLTMIFHMQHRERQPL